MMQTIVTETDTRAELDLDHHPAEYRQGDLAILSWAKRLADFDLAGQVESFDDDAGEAYAVRKLPIWLTPAQREN